MIQPILVHSGPQECFCVAGITSMSFNKVTITVSYNFCAAYRLLAYVAPGDVGLLVGEDDCLRSCC